jgi:hypothetical protein
MAGYGPDNQIRVKAGNAPDETAGTGSGRYLTHSGKSGTEGQPEPTEHRMMGLIDSVVDSPIGVFGFD